MDIAVTGSTGLVGSALVRASEPRGHTVRRVVRTPGAAPGGGAAPRRAEVRWDPARGGIDPSGFEGVDAVVHLAGESIGSRRWTSEQKRRIRDSRVDGTRLVAGTLARLARPPSVLISASAVGWYGDRGDEVLTESSPPPARSDFLSETCREWEGATAPAEEAGIRVLHLRTGLVLARHGGSLPAMLVPFRLGLGGRQGRGTQWMSWIALDDAVAAILHLLDAAVAGPVDLVAPEPVRNRDFARALGGALRRPAVLPTPMPVLRARYGRELVDSLLLVSQRAVPAVLGATGFRFAHPEVRGALDALLG